MFKALQEEKKIPGNGIDALSFSLSLFLALSFSHSVDVTEIENGQKVRVEKDGGGNEGEMSGRGLQPP